MRGVRGRLTRGLALVALAATAACSRSADAVPAGVEPGVHAALPATPAAGGSTAAGRVTEASSANAPLRARVVSVRRESADSIRVELALANLAAAEAWTPGSPARMAVQTAIEGMEEASVLSADGRRRMFALRGSTGERVGSPIAVPGPGRSETFWTMFPAAEGEVSVLLPGFPPLSRLAVAPRPDQPEP